MFNAIYESTILSTLIFYLLPSYRLEFTRLNDLVYVHYNLRLWMAQIQKELDANAISLDNIDILS